MSTENNSELLFNNSVKILTDLIGFKTISGEDNSSLIDYCCLLYTSPSPRDA